MSKLHTLWGKARDAADYDKSEWLALQQEIEALTAERDEAHAALLTHTGTDDHRACEAAIDAENEAEARRILATLPTDWPATAHCSGMIAFLFCDDERGTDVDALRAERDTALESLATAREAVAELGVSLIVRDSLLETVEANARLVEQNARRIEELTPDAMRWRSLMACERIRVVGGADLGTPNALLGLDFHKKHPDRDDAQSRKMLLDFVDFREVPDGLAVGALDDQPASGAPKAREQT